MAGLRVGIDVGGTFTHGVVLRPPGEVLCTARTPTTHTAAEGVAAGVQVVLRDLINQLAANGHDAADVELVAHSTTQATNALLEGDVAPVLRYVILPPGEGWLVKRALKGSTLDLGGGHKLAIETRYIDWADAPEFTPAVEPDDTRPVAVIQPLAGGQELREQAVADVLREAGRQVVCASEITEVLGLAARARTATINAAMLPTMLATADYTEQAVNAVLPGVPVQVVRSDGGAMSLQEMRRQPILSLLSGPAAGASAALNATGLSEVVFIEVGGTSTDITLIKEGRVRHRYATVGGHRLMVPALDLRTIAVGGGSMLRAHSFLFGPRSAHIAGMPYLFQELLAGKQISYQRAWSQEGQAEEHLPTKELHEVLLPGAKRLAPIFEPLGKLVPRTDMFAPLKEKLGMPVFRTNILTPVESTYLVQEMDDGSTAATTLTDMWLAVAAAKDDRSVAGFEKVADDASIRDTLSTVLSAGYEKHRANTIKIVVQAVQDLARTHGVDLVNYTLLGGGGGAPCIIEYVAEELGMQHQLVDHHAVISAIGAALAVTCVSLSRSVAEPSGSDIAELTRQVETRLSAQGAERVSTDYEFDSHRQVLTVTGRGSRAYDQDAEVKSQDELAKVADGFLDSFAERVWQSTDTQLWLATPEVTRERLGRKAKLGRLAVVLDRYGRSLWHGQLNEWFGVPGGEHERVLSEILDSRMQYTDGGAELPGLAYACAGRLIPLDTLGSAELIVDVLRWEELPADAEGCFLLRR